MKNRLIRCLCVCLCLGPLGGFAGCSGNTSGTGNLEGSTEGGSVSNGGTVTASYTVDCDTSSLTDADHISDTLYGLFLEDINFAVDGGLYAELIKNRSFEYGTAAANEGMHGWIDGDKEILSFSITDGSTDGSCLNENNPHYAVLTNTDSTWQGIANVGYLDGLAAKSYPLAVDGADRLMQAVLADAIFTFLRHFFLSSCCIARGIVLYCD